MRKILAISFLLLVLNGRPDISLAQNLADKQVEAMHIEELGVPAVLHEISRQAHVTIGLEMDLILGKERHVELNFPGGTITDLANMCTSLLQGASWKIVDNRSIVISQPGKASLLAAVPIQYAGVTNATRQQVWSELIWSDHLSNRPEIEAWLRSERCGTLTLLRGHEWQGDRQTISIPRGSMSLGRLLATAASSSDTYYWSILKNTRDERCEIVVTLW
jgi:hypothetical protein